MTRKQILALCIALILCLCSCSQAQDAAPKNTGQTSTEEGGIQLSTIKPPSFMQRFAVIYFDGQHRDLLWGMTDSPITTGFFWDDSSFPGFNYTVVVQMDYYQGADTVEIDTLYGQYKYSFIKEYAVYEEDSSLINEESGEQVNVLDPNEERLAIYNSIENKVFQYQLTEGTHIKVE